MTIIRTTDPSQAARALLRSRLVILPTETVYGLAARADDAGAVARIYATKGRPADHPLIVHVADYSAAVNNTWAHKSTPLADRLAEGFWPGPLTLVLQRGPRSGDDITGGQDTVAIRVPAHPLARNVLQEMDELDPAGAPHGVAAPSANRFGRVSPTTVHHAINELGDLLADGDLALDGGAASWGVESTIIDARGTEPVLLRPGGVTVADLSAIGMVPRSTSSGADPKVPGALASHYAPEARVIAVSHDADLEAVLAGRLLRSLSTQQQGFIALQTISTPPGWVRLASPESSGEYAHCLYAALRAADERGMGLVVAVAPPPDSGLAEAVIDRLQRASATD